MSDDHTLTPSHKKSSHIRTSGRRHGVRLTKVQTKEAQEKFLKSFASNGNVRVACLAAGIDRSSVHYWSEHDEQFSMRYNVAKKDVDDAIRAEIFRRAMYGDEETTISEETSSANDGTSATKHKKLTSRRKSDVLLMFHAKARMPEYRDTQKIDHMVSFGEQAQKAYDELVASLADEDKKQAHSTEPQS